jgi:hypothetical protein
MVVRLAVRWFLTAAVLVVGVLGAYGLGAGYFSTAGIGVPSPWNYIVTAMVLLMVFAVASRIVHPTQPSARQRP